MSVRDAFKLMLRDEVAPALRRLGFKGSGVNYSLPDPELYRLIHFQAEEGEEPGTLDFTLNISLIDIAEYQEKWEPWLPKKPTAASILPVGRQFRVGALLGHDDTWWQIRADSPVSSTAQEVFEVVERHVVPELQRRSLLGPSLNREQYDDR